MGPAVPTERTCITPLKRASEQPIRRRVAVPGAMPARRGPILPGPNVGYRVERTVTCAFAKITP